MGNSLLIPCVTHYESEEMVYPITCTPNEEPEENIVEIDETFSEKESNVTTVFSWPNFSVQNRGSATSSGAKRHKVDSSVVVIDSPPESTAKRTSPPSLVVCEDVHTYI